MISDLLEQKGWQVRYLGANTPQEELLDLLLSFKPDLLALSVIMPFNLAAAAGIITEIRKRPELASLKIMVGGPRFNEIPELASQIGADGLSLGNVNDAGLHTVHESGRPVYEPPLQAGEVAFGDVHHAVLQAHEALPDMVQNTQLPAIAGALDPVPEADLDTIHSVYTKK